MEARAASTDGKRRIDAASLFKAHASYVAAFLFRLGAPRAEVDDLVQEVFMVAHRNGGYLEGPAKPTTWLAEIAIRVATTMRRKRSRWAKLEGGEPGRRVSDRPVEGPELEVQNRRALLRVQVALETLGADKRVVLVLFEMEGESCDAIAAAVGVPIGTVYSRLHAARREFKAALEHATAEGGAGMTEKTG
jgi:RNA polymerase sigma-70 factor (ECF subfamily)